MNQPATNAAPATLRPRESESAPVLTADGIEKSFRRGVWPFSHRHQVLPGVDLTHARLSH